MIACSRPVGNSIGSAAGRSVYPTISPAVLASQSRPGNGWGKSEPADAMRRIRQLPGISQGVAYHRYTRFTLPLTSASNSGTRTADESSDTD